MNDRKSQMNLPAPSVIGHNWYLLAEVTGYYGSKDVPCNMGIYLGIQRKRRYIYHVFLNGKEAYYGHTSTGDHTGRTVDIAAALSQAWSNYLVSPEKWHVTDNTDIKNPEHRAEFLQYLTQLRDAVAKHKNGAPVIPRPSVFPALYRAYFNAYEADIPTIPCSAA